MPKSPLGNTKSHLPRAMRFRVNSKCLLIATFVVFLPSVGCWSRVLPPEVPVPLADGTEVIASAQIGPPELANTEWSVYRDPLDPFLLFRMAFNENGDLVRIYDNEVFDELIGSELILNGQSQDSPWPGGTYVGEGYVAMSGSQLGFVALVNSLFGPIPFGNGDFAFSGTHDGQRIEGVIDLAVSVDDAFIDLLPFSPGDYQFQIVAVPVWMDHLEQDETTTWDQ